MKVTTRLLLAQVCAKILPTVPRSKTDAFDPTPRLPGLGRLLREPCLWGWNLDPEPPVAAVSQRLVTGTLPGPGVPMPGYFSSSIDSPTHIEGA